MNQIYTSEGNIMFVKANGKITNVHPFNVYTHFNKDTVSFVLIALPESSGLSFFTSKADDLEIDGEQYTFDELKEVIPEKFKMSGAQARCEIVEELPTTGQTNTIYLVPIVEGTQINRYDEYIYIKEQEKWELLGDTSIEMDKYYTKTQVDEKLSAKADTATTYTKTQVDTLLNDKQDTLTAGDGITISGDVISFDSDKERTIATALSELKNEKLEASAFVAYSASTDTAIANKQNTLVSGENIKTINNESILGSGNIEIQGGGKAVSAGTNISITTGETADTINCTLNLENGTNSQSGGLRQKSYVARNYASGRDACAFGGGNIAGGINSFVTGYFNTSSTSNAFVSGYKNETTNDTEILFGMCALSNGQTSQFNGNSGCTLFAVGNGEGMSERMHNAFEIRQNGDIYIPDTNDTSTANYYEKPMIKLQDTITALGGLKLVKLTQAQYDALSTKDSNTLYVIEEAPECNIPQGATYHTVDDNFDKTTQIYGIDFSNYDALNNEQTSFGVGLKSANNIEYTVDVSTSNVEPYFTTTVTRGTETVYTADVAGFNFCDIFGEPMYISDTATIPSYETCVNEECTEYDCLQYDEETGECIEQGDCINTQCIETQTNYPMTALY